MFGSDKKYLSSNPPVVTAVMFVAFAVLSLFLLVQCSRSDADNPASSSGSTSQTSSSASDSSSDASSSDAPATSVEFDRADGYKKGPQEIRTERTFSLTDTFTIGPVEQDVDKLRAWLEVPLQTRFQTVENLSVDAGGLTYEITKDPKLGNRFVYVEINDPEPRTYDIVVSSRVTRSSIDESYAEDLTDRQKNLFLRKTDNVPVNADFRSLARKQGATGSDLDSIREIYDFVVDNSTYYKANPNQFSGSGEGDVDAQFCLYQGQGGCTDFHALYMSMARSVNVPTRFVIGSYLPREFDGKDQDVAYHCWAEAHVDGRGWLALDAAYADLWPDLHDFYFGQLDARRVAFSRGRGITLVPQSSQKKVDYFIQGHVEADGKTYDNWNRKLTFEEVK